MFLGILLISGRKHRRVFILMNEENALKENRLPSISIVIPTYNCGSFLDKCLFSIVKQDYPRELIEILIIDGGSTDNTIEVAKKYTDKIYKNPLRTGEAGKAVGVKKAKNDLVALIDSDNLLPDRNWLKSMVEPFADKEIIGSEPWAFSYRESDGFIDRYCALLGMNDPICHFLGNYDRLNTLTGRWTSLPINQEDCGNWINVKIKTPFVPTIGANGTLLRKNILLGSDIINEYLFDVDIIANLAQERLVCFAKIKNSIVHLYAGNNIFKFIRKQKRRVKDYLYYNKIGIRDYPWLNQNKLGLLKFIFYCIMVFPLIYDSIEGFIKKPDRAWFFHPLACWLTLLVYSFAKIGSIFKVGELSREKWKQ